MAEREDTEARTNPVTCTFVNDGASSFYLIDRRGNRVPLSRMVIKVTYRVRYSIIPFDFRQYIDHAKGNQLYTAAFASIDRGGIKGDLVIHHDGTAAKVTFVPRTTS